jgi:hypothetical protein
MTPDVRYASEKEICRRPRPCPSVPTLSERDENLLLALAGSDPAQNSWYRGRQASKGIGVRLRRRDGTARGTIWRRRRSLQGSRAWAVLISESRWRAKRLGVLVLRPHEQTAENDRDEKESGHVSNQMTVMHGRHRLHRHDAAMHDARPHCEPDQAAMGLRVSRRIRQEDAERRVYPDDHHEILGFIRSAGVPRPAGRPHDRQRIEQQKGCTDTAKAVCNSLCGDIRFLPLWSHSPRW